MIFLWSTVARYSGILQGRNEVAAGQGLDWLITPATYLLSILFVFWYSGLTVVNVLICLVFALLVSSVIGRLKVGVLTDKTVSAAYAIGEWRSSWLSFTLIQTISVLNLRAPIFLLFILGSEADAGVFRVADSIGQFLSVILIVVNVVIGPRIAAYYSAGNLTDLQRLARNSARVAFAACLLGTIAFFLVGEWLIRLVFGDEFIRAYGVVLILAVGQLVNTFCGSVGLILSMTGHERKIIGMWACSLLLNVAIGFFLIPALGAEGAAVGVLVGMIAWNVMLLSYTWRQLEIKVSVL
ncbi:MAG: polysaccharide biosynthesis C-terminal domain-containing protein [Pseudomonadales bacterium]